MKPAAFEYLAPTSLDEALALLGQHGGDAKLLAGGQSLVPLLNLRLATPAALIDLNGVAALDYIRADDAGVAIGAMTRQRALERAPEIGARLPLLGAAVEWIGHWQIRNRGTVGGSLAHADPASELPAIAMALDARFTVLGADGARRTLAPDEFFVTYLTTALGPDELLGEVYFPAPPAGTGWAFAEVARRHGDFALVGVATTLRIDGDGTGVDAGPGVNASVSGPGVNASVSGPGVNAGGKVVEARVALMGVGATPVRATAVERALVGRRPDEGAITAAAAEVAHDIEPQDDVHASAAYRRHVAGALVRRALAEAARRAG